MKKITFLFRFVFWEALFLWRIGALYLGGSKYLWWRGRCKLIIKNKI